MANKGQARSLNTHIPRSHSGDLESFVLEKNIFANIFEKDIKRVFIYKKAERLAKAIHLVAPAFRDAPSLRNRIDAVAVGLVDAAVLPPSAARDALSRELLTLSSVLSIARTGGMLSSMNATLIAREAQTLLQEVAAYEEPQLFLDDAPSLAELAKAAPGISSTQRHAVVDEFEDLVRATPRAAAPATEQPRATDKGQQGHVKDNAGKSDRRDAILAIIRKKGNAYIKDVSTVIRNVSEKTIQRELAAMVEEGILHREGERRWTSYSLAA